jgi:hypothetical protein
METKTVIKEISDVCTTVDSSTKKFYERNGTVEERRSLDVKLDHDNAGLETIPVIYISLRYMSWPCINNKPLASRLPEDDLYDYVRLETKEEVEAVLKVLTNSLEEFKKTEK